MKTEYNILWIDDDMESVITDQEAITDYLKRYGIEAVIKAVELDTQDPAQYILNREKIDNILKRDDLDIIFVDFKMKEDHGGNSSVESIDGDVLIERVRDSDNFLPVIFYSQHVADMRQHAANRHIDGVYFSARDKLTLRAEAILESLLRKEHTVKRARGLLMDGLSEVEAMLDGAAKKAWEKLPSNKQNEIVLYFKKLGDRRIDDATESRKKIPDVSGFIDVFALDNEKPKYDANTRWRLLNRILKALDHDQGQLNILKELDVKSGAKPLFSLRNKYAHKTCEVLAADHDKDMCIYIRKELRKQINNMKVITEGVS